MEKSNRKAPIVFYIGLILLCVWLASFHLFGGLYARYSSFASGSDSARVAGFSVTAVAVNNNDEMNLDLRDATDAESESYMFSVSNNSEVKVAFTVTITLDNKLPDGVRIEMKQEENSVALTPVSDTVFTCSSTLDFVETHTYTLIFTGDPAVVSEEMALNVSIGITAEQID